MNTKILPNTIDTQARQAGMASLKMHFLNLLHSYRNWMLEFDLSPGSAESDALHSFEALTPEKQLAIYTNLEITLEHIEEVAASVRPYLGALKKTKLPKELEFKSLEKMLSRRRLMMSDSSVLDTIDDEDIFEVYDAKGIQLYRSWSCYEFCFYNLVDLQVYDWDSLYIRPSWVVGKLYELEPALFVPGAKTMPYSLPEYLLTERLQKSNRSLLFKMKFASPILDTDTLQPVAFLSTGRMSRVLEADAALNVGFV